MRVVFLGNATWSVPPLESVARSGHEIALVATRVPRPAGRGGTLRPTPVAVRARELDLPLRELETVKDTAGTGALREAAADVLVVVAYGEILPGAALDVPRVAPVNVHFSLLPALRGADPVRRAILAGHDMTGVTTIRMDEGMDTGPILRQREVAIGDEDDAGTLGSRLASVGGGLLVETLDALERGTAVERPQDESLATFAPKLRAEEEWIDWTEDASGVLRRVRALAPDPGARTRIAERLVKVVRASAGEGTAAPGTVLRTSPLVIAAGRGAVALDAVVPEGRRRMTGEEFARGRRLEPGMRVASGLA